MVKPPNRKTKTERRCRSCKCVLPATRYFTCSKHDPATNDGVGTGYWDMGGDYGYSR